MTFLRTDPQFYAKTPHELLANATYVLKKMDGKLKDTIGFLPRFRHGVMPVPDSLAPIYTGGRGGLENCMFNTYNLPARPLYTLPALALHECTPGHSFQAALALEGPERPGFRKEQYFSGYGEGWGLYTEWLGGHIGIYETPYEEFGQLTYEIWRAARLVVDTGIHHYGWSREQALAYMKDNVPLSEHEITTEVDRYIAWPGQALAYKLGEMQIRRHRREAEAALGAKFDQRKFHDAILALGAVPLPVLAERMAKFIADGGENPDPVPWSSPRDSISMAGRVPRRDDAVRPGLFARPACLPAHRDRARRRWRRRPGAARHGRREQLAATGREAHGARRRRRGCRRARAAGRGCFRAFDRSRGGVRARRREDRRECADGAARDGLCADGGRAVHAFQDRRCSDVAADHAVQQSARVSRVDRAGYAGAAREDSEHRCAQGERARSAPLHRHHQSLRRSLCADGRARRRGARSAAARCERLGVGTDQRVPARIRGA